MVMFLATAMMNNKNGFTLVEMLFVLAVWSVLMLLIVPIPLPLLNEKTEEYFLETLEMDLLYTQSMSYNSRTNYMLMFPDDRTYVIKQGGYSTVDRPVVKRKLPDGWKIQDRLMSVISFNQKGTIRKPGTFAIKTSSSTYNIVCPLGKGRCYIEEQ
ncbi:type II secretion system protein [Lentibacillus cibarius]|uniref:Type II secretion system protein n=2 Tax=Lentibacillus cibarius TaxID=2583219 RepID=A0A549YLF0_9BACI|nr:type II secretion system protein [Lentibacillus cibarius]